MLLMFQYFRLISTEAYITEILNTAAFIIVSNATRDHRKCTVPAPCEFYLQTKYISRSAPTLPEKNNVQPEAVLYKN